MLKEYLMQNNYFRKNELDKKIEKKSMVQKHDQIVEQLGEPLTKKFLPIELAEKVYDLRQSIDNLNNQNAKLRQRRNSFESSGSKDSLANHEMTPELIANNK